MISQGREQAPSAWQRGCGQRRAIARTHLGGIVVTRRLVGKEADRNAEATALRPHVHALGMLAGALAAVSAATRTLMEGGLHVAGPRDARIVAVDEDAGRL